jgi:hypothetical protein
MPYKESEHVPCAPSQEIYCSFNGVSTSFEIFKGAMRKGVTEKSIKLFPGIEKSYSALPHACNISCDNNEIISKAYCSNQAFDSRHGISCSFRCPLYHPQVLATGRSTANIFPANRSLRSCSIQWESFSLLVESGNFAMPL